MNREWVREQLVAFNQHASMYIAVSNTGVGQPQQYLDKLNVAEPTIRKILEVLDPGLAKEFDIDVPQGINEAHTQTLRAIGILNNQGKWADYLLPDAPSLAADQFHPWVWDSARTLWESKHYRLAVEAATNAVNAFTQNRVERRDISGTDLMNQVFAEKPKSGQKVLRFPGDPTDETVKNRNRALRPFAEGCYAGIRNLATHTHGDDWDQQKALEYLAAFSILARWIEECTVEVAP